MQSSGLAENAPSPASPRLMMRGFIPWALLVLLALPLPGRLLPPGFWQSGDGMHHLFRVAALGQYVNAGMLFPRWFGDFSFGYGAPVLNFYNPLSYYLALPFTLLGPLTALKGAMLLAAILSAAALFVYARQRAQWPLALLAALVYLYLPYRAVDLYTRAALAEHVAFIWYPLILLAADRLTIAVATGRSARPQITLFALFWAGLLLTHSFSAVMFAPFALAYLIWLAARAHDWRVLLWSGLGGLLAAGLSAFFWLPLLREQQFAGLGAGGISTGYRQHLMRLGQMIGGLRYDFTTGELDPSYFALGFIPFLLLIMCLGFSIVRVARRRGNGANNIIPTAAETALFGGLVTLVALFMTLGISQPLWDALARLLAPMQFPWRFFGMATFGISLSVLALPFDSIPNGRNRTLAIVIVSGFILLSLALTTLSALNLQPLTLANRDVTAERMWEMDTATGQAGTTWGGEFIPAGVREQRWALGRRPEQPSAGEAIAAPEVTLTSVGPDRIEFAAANTEPWPLRYHAFYFPGWQVRVDGRPVPTVASGDMGLVTAEIPAGEHTIRIAFESTRTRTIAAVISLLSTVILLFLAWPGGRVLRAVAILLVGLALLAGVNAAGVGRESRTPAPVQTQLSDFAQLLAWEATPIPAADALDVTLYWLALRQSDVDYKAFVHLMDGSGQVVAQHDGDPVGGYTPTTRWQPGELIIDRHRIPLPPGYVPGSYAMAAGMYELTGDGPANLAIPQTPDNRAQLGGIEIY
ncbi:MAG: hypothetical protein J5I90_17930 [Caldilineales bacterium]|nr:hypothetical protein [Caldilineales bacterium]